MNFHWTLITKCVYVSFFSFCSDLCYYSLKFQNTTCRKSMNMAEMQNTNRTVRCTQLKQKNPQQKPRRQLLSSRRMNKSKSKGRGQREESAGTEGLSAVREKVTGRMGSPVRLSVVRAQLLPEDSVSPWGGQKAALSLRPAYKLHLLNLNGHLSNQPESHG